MAKAQAVEDDTYWIDRPDQLRCLVSARRSDIVDRLAALGPASIKELADALGARPPALYHHMRLLQDVDLVRAVGHRVVRRRREALYATPSHRMRMARALADPANRALMREIVAALTRQMDRDFREGIDSSTGRTAGEGRNLGFFRLIGRPTPEDMGEINRHLDAVAEILWRARDGEEVVVLNWILAPAATANVRDGLSRRDTR